MAKTTFEFSLPQWQASNYSSVSGDVTFWSDVSNGKQRIDFYKGMDQNYLVHEDGLWWGYYVYPVRDQQICGRDISDMLSAPISAFPDFLDEFQLARKDVHINGRLCDEYFRFRDENGAVNNYTFYVTSDGTPVRYVYKGMSGNLLGYLNSPNYDWFQIDYTSYQPNIANASAFELPALCTSGKARPHPSRLAQISPLLAKFLSPAFSRVPSSRKTSTLSSPHGLLNPYPSVIPDDKRYLPKSAHPSDLPKAVDWRLKGAISPMKDQGNCGSCWSFGSTGAVESAWFIKTGQMIPLSEQYLMDCSWEAGNNACGGGAQFDAYSWVINKNQGKWPSEQGYPYLQNEGYCKLNISSQVTIKDYKFVVGRHALMDALANSGPVTVSVSTFPAGSWAFYHGGIYWNMLCNPIVPDHSVLAVGYGYDEKDNLYWILKNQWSAYWGEKGYMRISAAWDDCGVESYGVLPIV